MIRILALLTPTAALAHPWGHDGTTQGTDAGPAVALILAAAGLVAYRKWARP